ncbi:MAG: HAD family phosphatase [Parachlamydiaceae bacterium]|nr:HAD family phosphatase [Parachlamydiaceae bacterium]
MKGIIALDIDGTITNHHTHLQLEVRTFLKALSEDWFVVFISGRTFTWGYEVLQHLDFPYYLAVHNGAVVFHMPSKEIVLKTLVPVNSLPDIDLLFDDLLDDYILYPESEGQPICFYRPKRFSKGILNYFKGRSETFQEKWIPVEDFKNLPFEDFFALKYFGSFEHSLKVASRLESKNLHAPIIKDPYDVDVYIIQATHCDVTKGSALEHLKSLLLPHGITIAAGDDNNDASMLAFADVKVVMATAPEYLLKIAHVIAPPASEMGIISGLKDAINRVMQNGR